MKKITVIGGGISGLYIANLFMQNPDYEITVFEKNNSVNLEKNLNFKISNMNMNIIVQFTRIKESIPNSSWIDSSKLDGYTLPTFTKKIFSYLEKN